MLSMHKRFLTSLSLIYFSCFFIIISLSQFAYSVEKGSFEQRLSQQTEEEDKKSIEDILLDPNLLLLKYSSKLTHDLDKLSFTYDSLTGTFEKIAFLNSMRDLDFKDKRVWQIFESAILDHISSFENRKISFYLTKFWKVRAVAMSIISEKASELEQEGVKRMISAISNLIHYNRQNHPRSFRLICLAKLISQASQSIPKEQAEIYYHNTESMYLKFLNFLDEDYHLFNNKKYYFYWALVRSLGIIKSQKSFFKLLKCFERFNYKIKHEVIRSIKLITEAKPG